MYSDFLDGIHTMPPATEGINWNLGEGTYVAQPLPVPYWTRPRLTEAQLSGALFAFEEQEQELANLRKKKTPSNRQWDPLGCREFTLTYSKNWFDDDAAREAMRLALSRIGRYYAAQFVQFRAVGEVGSGGQSHIHCFYELEGGKKITDKNFQRAYPRWDTSIKLGKTGHQGGHHASVKDVAGFKAYIEKDLDTDAWLDLSLADIS